MLSGNGPMVEHRFFVQPCNYRIYIFCIIRYKLCTYFILTWPIAKTIARLDKLKHTKKTNMQSN